MINVTRNPHNPLLEPSEKTWEFQATFNPTITKHMNEYYLFYRAMSSANLSVIGRTISNDGINFSQRSIFIKPEQEWEKYGCEDPRITKIDNEYFIFYTALSEFPPVPYGIKVGLALSSDLNSVLEKHLITPFNAKAMALFPEKINGKYAAILTVNTDMPPSYICLAFFDKKEDIWSHRYWQNWYQNLHTHAFNIKRFNSDHVEVGSQPVKTDRGWLVVYSHIQRYQSQDYRIFGIEALLLDLENPQKIIGRTRKPFITPQEWYETGGIVPRVTFPSGALIDEDKLSIYYGAADTRCCEANLQLSNLFSDNSFITNIPKLKKYESNPILELQLDKQWESQAVFNPAIILEKDITYIIYRALSENNTSSLGLAVSHDGFTIDKRLDYPIYTPRKDWEMKKKPGGLSGCEDPRITKIADRFYMCYTAFNGIDKPKVALTSISVNDFINQNFNWAAPVIISDPDIEDKNCCLMPEKINGKFVFFHRPDGKDIYLDYVENLNFINDYHLKNEIKLEFPRQEWYGAKTGIVCPPFKTDKGWLLLFHGVSSVDNEYRLGYMVLDISNPAKVLHVSEFPILEATEKYERFGIVNNVVFSCGAVIKDNELFVYYGGADKVICLASIQLIELLSF